MSGGFRVEPVADLDDPRLADYRNLKDAELLVRRGRFIVEGRGNLRVLLARSPFRPESLLLGDAACAALRAELEPFVRDIPIYVAPPRVIDVIVGFKVHRGALAACARPAPREPLALARETLSGAPTARIVVLEEVRDADNVGGVFRAAMALGARAVFLGGRTCDPLYRKAIRTSMGGSLCVPFARVDDLVGWLGALRGLGVQVLAFDPKEPGEAIDALRPAPDGPTGPAALLLGTEGDGLSAEALAAATRRVRIPMEPGVDSLNVAMAAAIGLHVLRGGADAQGAGPGAAAVRSGRGD
jgi:tRNA G18 (ribose-2'-O)-methylase SpoU